MTITPPPPADLAGLRDAYAVTTAAVLDLAEGVGPGAADGPTDCPGWSVADQVRHVLTIEQLLLGVPLPDVDISGYAHVKNEFGVLIEKYLESARGLSLDEVTAELRAVRERRLAALSAEGLTLETEVEGPLGRSTLAQLIGLRIFDIWCHEQDLREALDRPGGLASPAAAVSMSRILRALPRAIATVAGLAEGEVVAIIVEGQTAGRLALRMVTDEQGRARGIPIEEGDLPAEATRITLTTREFTRRAAGRWPVERLSPHVGGDAGVARRVLEALTVTP